MSRALTTALAACTLLSAGPAFAHPPQEATPASIEAQRVREEDAAVAEAEADQAVDDQTDDGPSLRLHGFADFRYSQFLMADDAPIFAYLHEHGSFAVGNINLYAEGRLAAAWRSLVEVRFTYLPAGAETLDGTAWDRTSTVATDDGDLSRPMRWGGIVIERAFLEWAPLGLFGVRAGQWLSPYGIWNEDHGSPTIIPTMRPYVIGEELIPARQTGIEVFGEWAFGENDTLVYALTLSNGRGPVDFYRDLDDDKAIGGRLQLVHNGLGELRLGAAVYRGRYTDELRSVDVTDGIGPARDVVEQYDEWAFATDALWKVGSLHLQAEAIVNDRHYTEGGRPPAIDILTGQRGLASDLRRFGAYFLVGYRTPWLEIMPYVLIEHHEFGGTALAVANAAAFGLNCRPIPSVALKAQITHAIFPGAEPGTVGVVPVTFFGLQAAWAF